MGPSILPGVDYFAFGGNSDGIEFLAWLKKRKRRDGSLGRAGVQALAV